jgi:hypothetical protein
LFSQFDYMPNLELLGWIATPAIPLSFASGTIVAGGARESRRKLVAIVGFGNPTEPHHLPERLGLSLPILLMYFGFVWDTLKS